VVYLRLNLSLSSNTIYMTISEKLEKIGNYIDRHLYKRAQYHMENIDYSDLLFMEKRTYNIYKTMIMVYRADISQQYNHLRKMVTWYNYEVINFHYLMVRLHYLIKNQSRYRSSIIFDLIEIKLDLFEDKSYLLMLKLEKATYFAQLGAHESCLKLLDTFHPTDIPCPLMYHEVRVKALIELGREHEIDQLIEDVALLVHGLELDVIKQETLCAIRLRIALHRSDLQGISVLAEELRGILSIMEIPFSANHMLMITAYKAQGLNCGEIETIVKSFEVTDISKPFLEKLKNDMKDHQPVGIYHTVENVAEMIFNK